jgi:streptomycin 6-kinase
MDRYGGPYRLYYKLPCRPLFSHYTGPFREAHTLFNIALHGSLYIANKMERYLVAHTSITVALHGGLYLAIIMDGPTLP